MPRALRFQGIYVSVVLIAFAAACGTEPGQGGTNTGLAGDGVGGADNGTTFGDVGSDAATGDDTATGGDTTGTDGDATIGDDGSDATAQDGGGDAGCTRDSDCDSLEHGACQVAKCKLDTGVCFVAEEADGTICDDGDPCTDVGGVCKAGKCAAAPLTCDDANPCTTDTCDAANGCKNTVEGKDTACDDSNACTKTDVCDAKGICAGAQISCDDSNPCTADSCDPKTGCVNAAADGACDDGDACTEQDACAAGKCGGSAKVCDDGNPCTTVVCDKKDGCKSSPKSGPCDDGDACTKGELCDDKGGCLKGAGSDCDDKNPCTDDSCDVAKGCLNAAKVDGEACDDGTACTKSDACKAGKCDAKAVDCDDTNPCTKDTCDAATGCANTTDDSAGCDDEDPCTGGDACKAGKCGGKPIVDCEDNNPCTDDGCDPATKACKNTANTIACDDNSLCTAGDACKATKCQGGIAISCDDKNPCTTDSCDAKTGSCTNAANTEACDDGNACTQKDLCADSKCKGNLLDCNDNNPCTDDSCDIKTGTCGKVNVPDDQICEDGSLCTAKDACKAGVCKGVVLGTDGIPGCDDGNPCTDDSCDPAKGCVAVANKASCEDGDACTVGDVCADSKCVAGGGKKDCDDGNACSDDTCDKIKGCVSVNVPKACDDGNKCTKDDVCTDGKCIGGGSVSCADSNVCTTDKCDAKAGCTNTPNTLKCTDSSVCTNDDTCKDSKCVPGVAVKCDDGNPCTADSCDPKTGCKVVNSPVKQACDDGNSCTSADACDGKGKCVGVGKDCNDDNACTVDSCANNVCASKPAASGAPCGDGNTCTQKDSCDGAGKCVGSNPTKCDDGNPCTDDACVNGEGCKATANTAKCEDGKYCTENDICAGSKCTSGKPKVCDDGNSCTSDLCDETGAKCATFPKLPNTACDDGNLCTTGDKCNDKAGCVATPATCNDDNPCTSDSCDSKTGKCAYTVGTTCALRTVPDIEAIGYLDGDWHLTSGDQTFKWQADGTPSTPGGVNGGYSLNFNNGTNYDAGKAVNGTALTKYLYDASKVTGSMTLAFHSYNGVEPNNGYDKRYVEVSTDGFVTVAQTVQLDNLANAGKWWLETIDLSSHKGKKFQVRFRFDSIDSNENTGKGWFVDEVSIYAGAVVKVTNAVSWSEPFAAGNSAGWHMSTPPVLNNAGWGIDSTPSAPGGYDAASLNFNNGTNFQSPGPIKTAASGWALSPVIDLTGVTNVNVSLLIKSWYQGETFSSVDKRTVEVSELGFGGTTADTEVQFDNAASRQNGWVWESVDLTKFKGKKVRLRFAFDSVDGTNNTGKGWFIDDLRLDAAPLPLFADMITTGGAGNWTLNNSQSPVGWAVDSTGIAPLSPDASLNFNAPAAGDTYNFVCPSGKASVVGTASSKLMAIGNPNAGAALKLTFDAFVDAEATSGYDILTAEVRQFLPIGTPKVATFVVVKDKLGAWKPIEEDITGFKGMLVTLVFRFDSKDCTNNGGKGVAIDNVMIRATK